MNVVIYTPDFEPITVIDLPKSVLDKTEERGYVKIAVKRNKQQALDGTEPVITVQCKKILWEDGTVKPLLITSDEVLTLTLDPGWLPGQLAVVQNSKSLLTKLHNKVIQLMRKN